jgi:hypothetical protein
MKTNQKKNPVTKTSLEYSKPKMIAKNAPAGGYAAGCPSNNSYQCKTCFRQ